MPVERAETRDRGLGPVKWTGPARPFFAVGSGAPGRTRTHNSHADFLGYYLEVG